jgi:16S rRNA (cytosine967-C5)-methyltransferase
MTRSTRGGSLRASPARSAAFKGLRLVETSDLGDALARSRDGLDDARDRALATDLVTGTLRWRGALDFQLAHLSGRRLDKLDPEVLDALRLGAYQLLHLERVPASAVVNDSVSLVKAARFTSAAPFVNAVLRRLSRERDQLSWPSRDNLIDHLAVVQSHPAWLVEKWIARYGAATAEAWLRFNNRTPLLTLAANTLLATRDAVGARLAAESIRTEPTAIAPNGLRVLEGRPLASDAFAEGAFFVQDEASQIIPLLVAPAAGERVLDACAAPGGKTVALAALVATGGSVVATDVRARRTKLLAATVARCHAERARVVQIATRGSFPFLPGSFDAVLVDAPCSGLGTLRRDPDIKWKRSPGDLPAFAQAQIDLLTRAADMVRPGGRLVYSTCSSEPEENEEVVRAYVNASPNATIEPLSTLDRLPAGIRALSTADGFLRTEPARDGLEAFFGAVLRVVR